MLRPIGTEFKYVYPPSNSGGMNNTFNGASWGSSNWTTGKSGHCFTVFTYRIVAHSKTIYGDAETLEPVDGPEYYPALGYDEYCGALVPVPPPELLPLLSESWSAPIRRITYTQQAA